MEEYDPHVNPAAARAALVARTAESALHVQRIWRSYRERSMYQAKSPPSSPGLLHDGWQYSSAVKDLSALLQTSCSLHCWMRQ